jgi:hypothetical protein
MAASFEIQGPFVIPLDPTINKKAIRPRCPELWLDPEAGKFAEACGCYVFAMRAGRGSRPIYVGKAARTFRQECFTPHKIASHYQKALLNAERAKPVIFLVVLKRRRGRVNEKAINDVEKFLIQNAMKKNPELSNIQGRKGHRWSIDGVIRSGQGKPSAKAKTFKSALGM